VSTQQKRAHWHAIAKEVRTPGVYNWRSTHCHKRWEDLRRWARKIKLGKSSQCGRVGTDPPHAKDPGDCVPRPGWALEGCTAVT
ncbi:hypothetical protein NDU88_003523, partial [Pleurodeles waltl]